MSSAYDNVRAVLVETSMVTTSFYVVQCNEDLSHAYVQ
jgi:hypothetical protein